MTEQLKLKLIPFWMTLAVIAVDQVSKLIVSLTMTLDKPVEVLGDFFRLTFRKNPFIIFSLGNDLPPVFQTILFLALPVIAIGLLVLFDFKEAGLKQVYRLPLAAILGGGLGNILDRVFRSDGVIDFFDFKFYGLFGLNRWPTFNVADMSIVISVIVILIISLIHEIRKRKSKAAIEPPDTADKEE